MESPTLYSRNKSFHVRQEMKNVIEQAKIIGGLKFKLKIYTNSDNVRIVGNL